MFCPNCGANNNTGQKFCRTCGLNLEKVAESLTEQFPDSGKSDLARQQRMLEKFGSLAMCGFGVVAVMGVGALLYTIITKLIIPGPAGNIMTGIFMIAFIIFATLLLAYVFFNEVLKDKKKKINLNLEKELPGGKDTGKLLDEGHLQPGSSITENTTGLLYDKSRTSKL
jgi:nitrate reductase NapE component